jgi:hypothetical protein
MRRWLLRRLDEHFELLLTVAGVLIALAITVTQLSQADRDLAMVYLIWLQGLILWAVRRHALLGREALLRKLRAMLQDRVNNQLTVMLTMADVGRRNLTPEDREVVEQALRAARSVSDELAHLSVESLRGWESRYGWSLEGIRRLGARRLRTRLFGARRRVRP